MVFTLLPQNSAAGQAASLREKAKAGIGVEFGIDSSERKFIRPQFHFSWPLAFASGDRVYADLRYLQRTNGRLQGPIDYWVRVGVASRLSDAVSLDASLNHFCQHITSIFNPYILNLNELAARIVLRPDFGEASFGYGRFIGGSPGYDDLLVAGLQVPHLLASEFSCRGEFKWVNFDQIYYEAELSAALALGTDIFVRTARYYGLPAATYLGLRFSSNGANQKYLDHFKLSSGVYPFFNTHKLLVTGGFRLEILKNEKGRFVLDFDFDTPILSGSGFFAQFWPDRQTYHLGTAYEKTWGAYRVSWYARYDVDMPTDKAAVFGSSLSTGIALRNQAHFDRIEKPVRFEIWGGINLRHRTDFGGRLGLNTAKLGALNAGAEFRFHLTDERQDAEFQLFAEFGREITVRPFVGVKKIAAAGGESPDPDPFKRKLTAGVALFKWFD